MLLLTMMITSQGTAGLARASIVVVATTPSMFDLPSAGLLLIIGIDQFPDMERAKTNVTGNGIATAAVAKWEGELQAPRCVEQEDMLDPAQVPQGSPTERARFQHACSLHGGTHNREDPLCS